MFGIPYADVVRVQGTVVIRRCPECGEEVEERVDSDHKPIAPGYAEHYDERHVTPVC